MNLNGLATHSIRNSTDGNRLLRILTAAVQAVEPGQAVHNHLQRSGDQLNISGRLYDLRSFRRVRLVGAGKAGAPMACAAAEILGPNLTDGIVVVKEGYLGDLPRPDRIEFIEAGHPIPNVQGVRGAARLAAFLSSSNSTDLVIALISGGGSALLISPTPGVSLEDLQQLTADLLASGANIQEINTLRRHLEVLKGGGLARQIRPAGLITLVLSDVVGDPLDVIASGPTVPDPTTYGEAYHILEDYDLLARTPVAIREHLQKGMRGLIPETPKPGDPLFERVQNVIIGSNSQAALAALAAAEAEGFHTLLLTTFLQGEARQVGRFLGSSLRQIAASGHPLPRPACLIAGGETTVTLPLLPGDQLAGLGGRNQELALGAVNELAGLPNVALIAFATDGGDGPTDAAGAIVTGETLGRAQQLGLDPMDFLRRNDAYHFFAALDDLLKPGPTQTNVNDLTLLFAL
jgi:glycerate 2-kinase